MRALRLTNVYGPGMQAKDSIVARLMRAIRLGRTFEIYGDGRQVRDYVHVADVVDAVRLALAGADWEGPMVIGTGRSLSVLEVVEEVRRVTGAELDVRHGPAKPGEMPAVIVDPSRARAAGLVAARTTSREGLRGVWEEWSAADVEAMTGPLSVPGMDGSATASSRPSGRAPERMTVARGPSELQAELERLEPVERGAAAGFLAAIPRAAGAPLAVVIPAYNEEPTVADGGPESPGEAAGLRTEVIVVVDGARDGTAERAPRAGALVCDVPVNRGQGAALRLGYWLARARGAQVIATIDADGQYEPGELDRVVEPILSGRADFVSGHGAWATSSPPIASAISA